MVIAIDNSNIINISYASMVSIKKKENPEYVIVEEDLGMFFHLYLKKIMMYLTSYENVIFCGEGKNSSGWRKSIWPPYKENRKDRADNPDYKYIIDAYQKTEELLKLLHCKVLRVDNCEGDDCIYQVCKYYTEQGEQVKIISTDKDLTQIMNFYPDLVTQYNPIKQCEFKANENIILEKCVIGDPSDNLKPFKGIGPKTFEKMLNDKALWAKKVDPEIFEKIEKVVDLRKYPIEYQNAIVEEIKKPFNEMDIQGFEKFLLGNGLKSCMISWNNEWLPALSLLGKEEVDCMDEIMDLLNS